MMRRTLGSEAMPAGFDLGLMVPSKAIKLQPRTNMSHGKWVAEHAMHHEPVAGVLPFAQSIGGGVSHQKIHHGRPGSFKQGSIAGMVMERMQPKDKGKGMSNFVMGTQEENPMHLDITPTSAKAGHHPHPKSATDESHHHQVWNFSSSHTAANPLLDEDHLKMLLGSVDADLMSKIRATALAVEALFKDADSDGNGLLNYFEVKALFRRISASLAEDVDKYVPEEERVSDPLINYFTFCECFLPLALSVPTELLLTRIPAIGKELKDRASVAVIRKGAHIDGMLPDVGKSHESARGHHGTQDFHGRSRRSSVAARKIQEELDLGGHHGHDKNHFLSNTSHDSDHGPGHHGHGHHGHGTSHHGHHNHGHHGHGHHGHGQHGHGHDDSSHNVVSHGGGFHGHVRHASAHLKSLHGGNKPHNDHGAHGDDFKRRASMHGITGHGLGGSHHSHHGENHQAHGQDHDSHNDRNQQKSGTTDSHFPMMRSRGSVGGSIKTARPHSEHAQHARRRMSMAPNTRIGENLFKNISPRGSFLSNMHL